MTEEEMRWTIGYYEQEIEKHRKEIASLQSGIISLKTALPWKFPCGHSRQIGEVTLIRHMTYQESGHSGWWETLYYSTICSSCGAKRSLRDEEKNLINYFYVVKDSLDKRSFD